MKISGRRPVAKARSRAATQNAASSVGDRPHATTYRLNQSRIATRYAKPRASAT